MLYTLFVFMKSSWRLLVHFADHSLLSLFCDEFVEWCGHSSASDV
jgi:hypothetical protein